jgi:hypothetical protein
MVGAGGDSKVEAIKSFSAFPEVPGSSCAQGGIYFGENLVVSKRAIGVSNRHRLTTLSKVGKICKTIVHPTPNAEEIMPKAASDRGIYRDLNHRKPHTVDANVPNNKPT